MSGSPLLEMRGIVRSFPGVQALRGVDLTLRHGEVLALLGENGAGKSTLMKILGGAFPADAGSVAVDGQPVRFRSPQDSRRAGIAVIYQEFNLIPGLNAVDNIFLGKEMTRAGFLLRSQQRRRAAELFARLGAAVDLDTPCKYLTTAQQQLVEIARALAEGARILVMDEPTASLTAHEVDRLFAMIAELRRQRIGIIYISHRLSEIFTIADRVTVLRDGANVGDKPLSDVTRQEIVTMMVGREMTGEFPPRFVKIGPPRLEVVGLCRGKAVRNVSFHVGRGEILALTGLVGAGRTETVRLIFGADRRDAGDIRLDGKLLAILSPRHVGEAAARQVAGMIDRSARVVIVVRDHPEDVEFAEHLQADIPKSNLVAVVRGEPRDARETLRKLKEKIDVVACTPQTAGWHSLAELGTDYPALGNPRIVQPTPYLWPDFLKPANLRNVASQISIIAVIAIGMTMVIITGGIDLSVGSLIALSSVVATCLIRDLFGGKTAGPLEMIAACAAAILLCAGVGLCTGTIVRFFDVPPFIVTLGMLLVGGGLAGVISQDQSINDVPSSFAWLGRGADLFDLPNAVVLMIVLYATAHVLMTRTRLGRHIYAVGGNREAARLSGVPVGRILMLVYTLSGLLAGVGGIMMASQFTSGSPNFGLSYELYAITAVVVGGTSLSGGEGTIHGTLIGAFTTAVIANGMNLLNVKSRPQMIVLGCVILAAVIFDSVRRRRV